MVMKSIFDDEPVLKTTDRMMERISSCTKPPVKSPSHIVVYFSADHNHRSINLNEHDDGKGDEAVLPKLV
ncbi:hypothetical protein BDA96_04G060700 [Sorghum bicolor]|uniref:Uncharacterized protein n=1 Tax=Sorghum bicolor TaxID=4558 RepID=A0A921R0U8_SORBI|nr:hypothetical protein BDA96_04G060700 [Sorghum bicolor]